jgi:hypothetical protein
MLGREEEGLPAQSAHASHPSSATQQQQRAAKHALFSMLEPRTSFFFPCIREGEGWVTLDIHYHRLPVSWVEEAAGMPSAEGCQSKVRNQIIWRCADY